MTQRTTTDVDIWRRGCVSMHLQPDGCWKDPKPYAFDMDATSAIVRMISKPPYATLADPNYANAWQTVFDFAARCDLAEDCNISAGVFDCIVGDHAILGDAIFLCETDDQPHISLCDLPEYTNFAKENHRNNWNVEERCWKFPYEKCPKDRRRSPPQPYEQTKQEFLVSEKTYERYVWLKDEEFASRKAHTAAYAVVNFDERPGEITVVLMAGFSGNAMLRVFLAVLDYAQRERDSGRKNLNYLTLESLHSTARWYRRVAQMEVGRIDDTEVHRNAVARAIDIAEYQDCNDFMETLGAIIPMYRALK